MKTLQQLKALGVQTLSVQNHEATAVNPYPFNYESDIYPSMDYEFFASLNLPPLPCHESVENGTYEIDRFDEAQQIMGHEGWKFLGGIFDDNVPPQSRRTVLVLSEPVAESEKSDRADILIEKIFQGKPAYPKAEPVAESEMKEGERLNDYVSRKAHSMDAFYAEKKRLNDVAEKPEGDDLLRISQEVANEIIAEEIQKETGLPMDEIVSIINKNPTLTRRQYLDILKEKPDGETTQLQKAIGLLSNLRHETDCLPDFYYEWMDKVLDFPEFPYESPEAEPVAEIRKTGKEVQSAISEAMRNCNQPKPDEVAEKPEKNNEDKAATTYCTALYFGIHNLSTEEQAEMEEIKGHFLAGVKFAKSVDVAEKPEGETNPDTKKCCSCGGRTALVTGTLYYHPDREPYLNGKEEDALIQGGDIWIGAYKCDDCEEIQGFWTE